MVDGKYPDPGVPILLHYFRRAPAFIRKAASDISDEESQVRLVYSLS